MPIFREAIVHSIGKVFHCEVCINRYRGSIKPTHGGAGCPSMTHDNIEHAHEQIPMLLFFWDSQGPVLEHFQEKGLMVNSAHYSEVLTDGLRPAIRTKCR